MSARSRRLVIDASVASAAGETLHSRRCREFLRAVLKICHRIVLTPTLTAEWNKHQSQFARTWRAEMLSLGKVVNIEEIPNERVRSQVPKRRAVQKDLHLIEAAIATDNVVVSLDDRAHADFRVEAAANITWVNALDAGGHAAYWLRKGAKPVKRWKLGHRA
jgi:hypothetical protein